MTTSTRKRQRSRQPATAMLLALALLLAAPLSSARSDANGAAGAPEARDGPLPEPEAQDGEAQEGEEAPGGEEGAEEDSEERSEQEPSLEERLDALLAEGADAEVYGEKENCLYRRKFSHIDVVSEDILIFSRGSKYWINQLKRSCLGLKRSMVIHTVTHGVNSLCSNDLVFANRPVDLNQGFTSSGRPLVVRANCVLGEFQSIPEPYAQALKGLEQ